VRPHPSKIRVRKLRSWCAVQMWADLGLFTVLLSTKWYDGDGPTFSDRPSTGCEAIRAKSQSFPVYLVRPARRCFVSSARPGLSSWKFQSLSEINWPWDPCATNTRVAGVVAW
jgi:hypothetical protein